MRNIFKLSGPVVVTFATLSAMLTGIGFSALAATLPSAVGSEYILEPSARPLGIIGSPDSSIDDNSAYALPFFMSGGVNASLADLKVTWSLGELSPDGKTIESEFDLRSSGLSHILPSRRNIFRIKAVLNFESCVGGSSSSSVDADQSIESVIASFATYKFSDYMRCTLGVTFESSSEDMYELNGRHFRFENKSVVDFLDDGDIVVRGEVSFYNSLQGWWTGDSRDAHSRYVRVSRVTLNPADDQAAEQAARAFTSLLKKYGQTLVDLRARNATPLQKRAAVQGFFNQNKAGFVSSLQQVNALFGKLSLMSKVRIIQSIQDGYSYVHYLENKIATEPMFDSVVNINLP